MVRKAKSSVVQNMKDGEGSLEIREILNKTELMGHGSLFAHIVVQPHSSIGYHRHVANTEPYYILSGNGVFEDNQHTKTPVGPGDVCLIRPGESHALYNPNDRPLEMIALVINLA